MGGRGKRDAVTYPAQFPATSVTTAIWMPQIQYQIIGLSASQPTAEFKISPNIPSIIPVGNFKELVFLEQ